MRDMKTTKVLLLLASLGLLAGAGFIYSGIYNVASDEPHWKLTFKLIEALRERSIAEHARNILPPPLDDPKLISGGAAHYSAMCTGCHLAPGMKNTEIRAGLYPTPPNFSEDRYLNSNSAQQFWIIKHGIKMTAMPAWGATHDDESIWGLVAFLKKLPGMSPEEYAVLTGGGHMHSDNRGTESPSVTPLDAPGTPPHSHGGH
ncbi:MAG: cytochrome c [Moraxellaceae bacterium]|nr:cytochrome c [Moraxellaceae bacterium]